MRRPADEMAASRAVLLAHALVPRDLARSVRADGVADGPFVPSAPVVAGFSLLEAPDLGTPVALAGPSPAVRGAAGSRYCWCTAVA